LVLSNLPVFREIFGQIPHGCAFGATPKDFAHILHEISINQRLQAKMALGAHLVGAAYPSSDMAIACNDAYLAVCKGAGPMASSARIHSS
jgi:hypothetical protein